MPQFLQRISLLFLSTTLAVALIPSTGHAVVDMKNSNYSDAWQDLTFAGSGYALRVQRTYNSRTTYSGIFGFGWCSEFETSIEKTPEGRLKLMECGAGLEVIYSPAKFDTKAMDRLVDQLVAHYKKTTPGATDAGATTLREQLYEMADLRAEWAKHAGLPVPEVKKNVVYSANGLEVEKIIFDGTNYNRTLADGTAQKFDANGHLAMMNDKNGNNLKLSYSGDNLKEVVDNTGKKLTFAFNQNHRVSSITGPAGAKAEYKYKGEDLIEIKNMWKNVYKHEYDETHNLTKTVFPDGTTKLLTYNQKNDWVTSFTDRAVGGPACVETYKYELSKNDPKNNFWSTAVKKCGNEVKNDARFEFWHKTRADGKNYLARVLTRTLSNTLDVTYHPELGRPVIVKKDGITTTFDYFANGLVKEKTTPALRLSFEYKNDFNKVSKVATDFLDAKGKIVRNRQTDFTYDTKSNLVTAQNSDGQSVKLTYDSRGRIATILDQAKKEVLVKWDDKTGKPAQITRPGVGSIKLTYKANGEINKVDSPDGPTVASQIAVTFNNLLDIIAPATSELSM